MTSRNLALITSIAAALAAPLAFAQSATSATAQDTTSASASMQGATATQDTTAAASITANPAAVAKKVSWSDLDGNKDGKLTKTEAAGVATLSTMFDKADADKDGALTPDEYKAYVASNASAGAKHGS